jgi:hypothetical protein
MAMEIEDDKYLQPALAVLRLVIAVASTPLPRDVLLNHILVASRRLGRHTKKKNFWRDLPLDKENEPY